jgi:hypothetical protein
MKQFWFHIRKTSKGQSFVELALMIVLLMTLLTGMIEFGNLLNNYVSIVDAAREGARYGSNADPFIRVVTKDCASPFCQNELFFTNIDTIIEGSETGGGALSPLKLDQTKGDNVIISYFSISGKSILRFPDAEGWKKYPHGAVSTAFTSLDIQDRLSGTAPDTGILLVEIFYHYSQLLGMPYFAGIPDPLPLHTYAIMPLSAAEPTPTPP